jgi:hypothetical protein
MTSRGKRHPAGADDDTDLELITDSVSLTPAGHDQRTAPSELLRHGRPATTAIYAKVDRTALGTLARPRPVGA